MSRPPTPQARAGHFSNLAANTRSNSPGHITHGVMISSGDLPLPVVSECKKKRCAEKGTFSEFRSRFQLRCASFAAASRGASHHCRGKVHQVGPARPETIPPQSAGRTLFRIMERGGGGGTVPSRARPSYSSVFPRLEKGPWAPLLWLRAGFSLGAATPRGVLPAPTMTQVTGQMAGQAIPRYRSYAWRSPSAS